MTKFTCVCGLSNSVKKSLFSDKGLIMHQQCIDINDVKIGKLLFTIIFLIFLGFGNVWADEILLNKAAITDLQNNNYGSFNSTDHDFTVSTVDFTGRDIAYNANGTPSGIANGQFIQIKNQVVIL